MSVLLYVVRSRAGDTGFLMRLLASLDSASRVVGASVRVADSSPHPLRDLVREVLGDNFSYAYRRHSDKCSHYNRAWNINFAVRELVSEGERFLIADADMLWHPDVLRYCDEAWRARRWVRISRWMQDALNHWPSLYSAGRLSPGYFTAVSGCFYGSRDEFAELGGFDERYRGWGAEDDDWKLRVEASGGEIQQAPEDSAGVAVHLWHDNHGVEDRLQTHRNDLLRKSVREGLAAGTLDPAEVNPCGWGLECPD